MRYILILVLLLFFNKGNTQVIKEYIIVTIEKESPNSIHSSETDYWIIDMEKWSQPNMTASFPLYVSGFSNTDLNECQIDKKLILYNPTVEESFDYPNDFLKYQDSLSLILETKKKVVQTVLKKWKNGNRERISVYLTPIKGEFCFCEISNKSGNLNIGYNNTIGMPISNFSFNSYFWNTSISKQIVKYDFSGLPFVSLQTME